MKERGAINVLGLNKSQIYIQPFMIMTLCIFCSPSYRDAKRPR